jgi:hypothetical protein
MTATMTPMTTPAAEPVRGRRARRLCVDAHTEFVANLVAELQSSVTRLRTAAHGLTAGDGSPDAAVDADVARLDREARDIARLVDLLDAVDGPTDRRRLEPLSLPHAVCDAGHGLDVPIDVVGEAGEELFVADAACIRTGVELLLLAIAGDGGDGPVKVRIAGDHLVILDGTMDLADPRRCWQLRSGRRVLEGEGCRLSLLGAGGRYRIELRAGR